MVEGLLGRWGLWYLYALFVSSVILAVIARLPRPELLLGVSALLAVAFTAQSVFQSPDIFFLPLVWWLYPFVVLGYLFSPYKAFVAAHRRVLFAAGLTAFLPLFYLRHPIAVPRLQPISALADSLFELTGSRTGYMFNIALPYLCASAAIVVLGALYMGREGRVIDVQAFIGRKTLGIYAMHFTVLWWLILRVGISSPALLSILALSICIILTALIEKVPVLRRILLGQRDSASCGIESDKDLSAHASATEEARAPV